MDYETMDRSRHFVFAGFSFNGTMGKKIEVPSDIGKIPNKIAMEDGFSGFTADQWKMFILIYATSITWDLLKEDDRKILTYFVRACSILVC